MFLYYVFPLSVFRKSEKKDVRGYLYNVCIVNSSIIYILKLYEWNTREINVKKGKIYIEYYL